MALADGIRHLRPGVVVAATLSSLLGSIRAAHANCETLSSECPSGITLSVCASCDSSDNCTCWYQTSDGETFDCEADCSCDQAVQDSANHCAALSGAPITTANCSNSCGSACCAADQKCCDGVCADADQVCCGSGICDSGEQCCGGSCVATGGSCCGSGRCDADDLCCNESCYPSSEATCCAGQTCTGGSRPESGTAPHGASLDIGYHCASAPASLPSIALLLLLGRRRQTRHLEGHVP